MDLRVVPSSPIISYRGSSIFLITIVVIYNNMHDFYVTVHSFYTGSDIHTVIAIIVAEDHDRIQAIILSRASK